MSKPLTPDEIKAKRNAYKRAWAKANPKDPKKVSAYNKANREKLRGYEGKQRSKNPEKFKLKHKQYAIENKDRIALRVKAYRDSNPEKMKELREALKSVNPGRRTAYETKRRAKKLSATPKWANSEVIIQLYAEASLEGLQIDHIIPLQHKLVCGLHVEFNLQKLSATANRVKGNRFNPMEYSQ